MAKIILKDVQTFRESSKFKETSNKLSPKFVAGLKKFFSKLQVILFDIWNVTIKEISRSVRVDIPTINTDIILLNYWIHLTHFWNLVPLTTNSKNIRIINLKKTYSVKNLLVRLKNLTK